MPARPKTVSSISTGKFFESHAKALDLELQGERVGFDRPISEPAMNRPGLALAGFFSYFAKKRVQVLGNSELSYLRKLPEEVRIDLSSMGEALTAGQLKMPAGITLAGDASAIVCRIEFMKDEEGTAESATPDAKAAPEVLTAKKEEGEAKK